MVAVQAPLQHPPDLHQARLLNLFETAEDCFASCGSFSMNCPELSALWTGLLHQAQTLISLKNL